MDAWNGLRFSTRQGGSASCAFPGEHYRDLSHLDPPKDHRRPDVQALDGAIKEQDIGQLFLEEFPAAEEQHPSHY
jgi:hypothetical protein